MFIFLLLFLAFFGFYYYLSYQVILLSDLKEIFSQTAIKAQVDLKGHVELVLEDLGKSYQNILMIIACATILSFLWILLLKYNAKIIIWLSILSLPVILSVGAFFTIRTYINLHKGNGLDGESNDGIFDSNDDQQMLAFDKALQTILTAELLSYVRNETLWLVLSIILCLTLTVSVILLHSLRERVSLSIALIRQASKAINGVKTTLVFPIIPRAFGVAVLIYGVMISLLIISASHPTYHIEGGPNHGKSCHPRTFNKSQSAVVPAQRRATLSSAQKLPEPQGLGTTHDFEVPLLSSAAASVAQQPAQSNNARVRFGGNIYDPRARTSNSQIQSPRQTPSPIGFVNPNTNNSTTNLNFTPANSNNILLNVKPQCVVSQPLSRQHVWKYHAINLFATLWLIHFISGISQTTLAGAFASYYWAFKKPRDVPYFAISISFFRVLRYHLGDIAFGAFLIATIRYIRIVIEFIDNRIRKKNNNSDTGTSTTRSVTCFFRIFFWLLDRFLRYIDRNAYIMMSMYGEGYLASAKRAVELLYKNSTRAIVLDYVTYFVLLVSRLLITGFAGYITAQEAFTANLHYKWLPILLVVLGTYFISKGLFSVYSMAVDTLFICFLIDSSNNDGSAERPYFMSRELRRIIKRNTISPMESE